MPAKKLVAGFGVLLLAGFGCNPVENAIEARIEAESGADVEFGNDGYTYTDEEGNQAGYGANVTLPSTFPSEIIRPSDSTIVSYAIGADNTMDASLMITSTMSLDALDAWYVAELEAAGWDPQQTYEGAQGIVRTYENMDGETLSLSMSARGEGSTAFVILSNE